MEKKSQKSGRKTAGERTPEIARSYKALQTEIAQRREIEKHLLAMQQQFNDILESLPCYMILLSPDYHVPFANKFFRERFGESHGKRCFEYLFNRTEPCEVCETFKVLKRMEPLEWEWTGPDGHNYYIYDFPFKDTDGSSLIMEVGIDITVQKRALADLRQAHDELELRVQDRTAELKEVNRLLRLKAAEHLEAEAREKLAASEWQSTFDSISDMVSIQDKDCTLVRVNKAYTDAVGLSVEEVTGRKCYEVVHGLECPIDKCPHQETVKTRKSVIREIFEPKLGIYLEVSTSPIFNESGELRGSVHIAKDISERKRVENLKDEFIGLVSHELRTPLTVITGSLHTAMSSGLPPAEVLELLQNAAEGADQLAAILENMLELSRYQAGRLTLRAEPVSIAGTARRAIKRLKGQRVTNEFSVDIPDDLPPAEADPMRVERILYNLLENAAKYSPEGSLIAVSARMEGQFVIIGVVDKGPGISREDQAKLFEQFQQLNTPLRSTKGVGLGLVVCKRLAEAQGGWIKVDSAPGKGSTFSFALPASQTIS